MTLMVKVSVFFLYQLTHVGVADEKSFLKTWIIASPPQYRSRHQLQYEV